MKILVIKIGSSIIAPRGKLDVCLLENLVKQIIEIERKGFKTVLVSSGAIALGLNKLGFKNKPQDLSLNMAVASLGQIQLMQIYQNIFEKYNYLCAQLLLTWDDFDLHKRFVNIQKTINELFNLKVIPVINENDAISFDEIRFGDNDRLAALVAILLKAQILIILSDVEGLLDEKEKVISEVFDIDKVLSFSKKVTFCQQRFTSGGMQTKLEAAKMATNSGIKTIICSGKKENVLEEIINGKNIGTIFYPQEKIKSLRKKWIAFSKKIKGKIFIDEGAKEALLKKGKSLLAVGVKFCEGLFKAGEAVEVLDLEKNILGCGLINYSFEELEKIKGKKNIEKEVIHRDNFVEKI